VLRIWISSYADPDPAVHVDLEPDPDPRPTVPCSRDDQLKNGLQFKVYKFIKIIFFFYFKVSLRTIL
jgi:hypothetical protein